MTTPLQLVTSYLRTRAVLVASYGARIYDGMEAPEGYSLAKGTALIIGQRTGQVPYDGMLARISLQARIYHANQVTAQELAMQFWTEVHEVKQPAAHIAMLMASTLPSLLSDGIGPFGLVLFEAQVHMRGVVWHTQAPLL